jgi:L-fucose mutarotase
MLLGIDPLLNGELLLWLDRMGHSDLVVISDAHFPAFRLGPHVIDVAGASPQVVQAVRSVIALDDVSPVTLMQSPEPQDVQAELVAAASVSDSGVQLVDRYAFYELAATANLILRTTETRIYANAILRKGVTP